MIIFQSILSNYPASKSMIEPEIADPCVSESFSFVSVDPLNSVVKMVVRGELSPDPSTRPVENFLPEDVNVIAASSSDSEEEEISYEGYEVLPQDLMEINNSELDDSDSQEGSSDEESELNINLNNLREIPSFDQSTKSELTELWNSPNSSGQIDIKIDSTKEEEIKNAMAGFVLPSTAIPPWAANIPEEEWKEQLKSRMALLNKVTAV